MPADAILFHRLRWRLLRNSLFLLWDHSLIRGLTIVLCSALIWSGLFALSWSGFHFLKSRNIPLDGLLMNQVFDLFFLVLTIFLLFSTGIIIYSSLFASPESAFLLSGPVREDKVFAYKFQAAVGFSSWAFVLLGSPILLAYGLEVSAPWYYYAALLAYFIGYVLIPGAIGAAITLVLVNFAPRRRKQLLTAVITSVALALLVRGIFWLREVSLNPLGSRAWFDTLLAELGNFSGRWLPYHWLARGLVASARAEVDGMAYNLALVWSNGLFLFVLVSWAAKKGFRRGFNLVATGGDLRRRYGGHWLDQALDRVLFFLHPQTRVLIVKDFRTFRRDPAQLWQIIILAGLAVIYFLNMRYFYQQDVGRPFQNGISLLTLAATSFWLCAYTGRFIFPLLSLEGRKFWILGLLPLDRQRLLWGKFAFSAAGCLALSSTLVLFSDLMLHMPWFVVVLHWVTAVVLSLGLNALSVGLVACLPNFRETDPSKIAVGFGGTLNLVTGLLFLLAVIGSMAGPAHFWLATHPDESATAPWWIWVGLSLGLLIGLAAIWLPLRAGARNLRRIEF